MLKNILKLDGAQKLSNKEQKNISGGIGITIIRQCSNAIAAGCVTNITAAACVAGGGLYNSTCKCCNY